MKYKQVIPEALQDVAHEQKNLYTLRDKLRDTEGHTWGTPRRYDARTKKRNILREFQ